MNERKKIRLVQAITGAIVLTLLMQVMVLAGYAQFIWMLFLPMLLFFALGADFKLIPSMIICYICGVLWSVINGYVATLFGMMSSNMLVSNLIPTIIVIFLILTVHDNLLEGTIFGNIPCIFLGLSTSFFVSFMQIDITPFHLVAFFLYGLVLTVCLVLSGMLVCSAIFGKEKAMKAIMPPPPTEKDAK